MTALSNFELLAPTEIEDTVALCPFVISDETKKKRKYRMKKYRMKKYKNYEAFLYALLYKVYIHP